MESYDNRTGTSNNCQEEIQIKRIKFRISTWEDGRAFMKEIAEELSAELEIRDAREVITTDLVEIHFHPDDRGFSFIMCKLHDESLKPMLERYISRYKEN
ncbi:MAG: hypothetical protein ACFFDT_16685 [Candidatus Hodarchaeota archaeon]